MSNTILTPNIIANEALDVLRTNAVMANLVHRDYSSEFVAGVGDTITVRKPATFEAKEFTTEVEVQDATAASYTHLTPPPTGLVEKSWGAASLTKQKTHLRKLEGEAV